jgi:hypothetical protein
VRAITDVPPVNVRKQPWSRERKLSKFVPKNRVDAMEWIVFSLRVPVIEET